MSKTAHQVQPTPADRLFTVPRTLLENRPDGSLLLRSARPLGDYPTSTVHSFRSWAAADPDVPLVAERDGNGGWRTVGYGQAERAALSIGQSLLDRGLGPHRPLLILSGNSVDHLLVTLGALTAGVPVVPTSVAYSLQSRDHGRIKEIAGLVGPGAVFAEDGSAFEPALAALEGVPAVTSTGDGAAASLSDLLATAPGPEVEAAFAGLTPDTLAKILFTSGSTGSPKGVLVTHRMWAANQQMMRQVWPFLAEERPVIVDWLPWSHTFGGNHNVGMVLTCGGTLYVDGGRPAPGLFAQTLANVAEVRPTVYFNVPAGYAQLVPRLESDPELASAFFSRLRLAFNAAAALPEALRERLVEVARRTTGRPVPVTGSWGLTETAPAVTNAHFDFEDARCIGVPLPGAEVKLLPCEDEDIFEIRARGPMVTPGYFGRPDLTGQAFDPEGFYVTGDAVALADPADPDKGLLFKGRLAEDFKLTTGTFVRVGAVRTALLSALPVLSDAVIAGEGRDCVTALAWLNPTEASRVTGGGTPETDDAVVTDPALAAHVAAALAAHHDDTGSAGRIERILLMARPADLDAGEITDKGYVNQRTVLRHRSDLVDLLYAEPPAAAVITPRGGAGS